MPWSSRSIVALSPCTSLRKATFGSIVICHQFALQGCTRDEKDPHLSWKVSISEIRPARQEERIAESCSPRWRCGRVVMNCVSIRLWQPEFVGRLSIPLASSTAEVRSSPLVERHRRSGGSHFFACREISQVLFFTSYIPNMSLLRLRRLKQISLNMYSRATSPFLSQI